MADAALDRRIEEYQEVAAGLRNHLAELRELRHAELRQRLLATVQNELSAVQVRATTFESQVTRASNATRATYTPTLKLFQNEVASFRRDVARLEAEIGGGAAVAAGGSTAAAKPARREVVKGSQRERVLEAQLAQQGTQDSIRDVQVRMHNSLSAGADVLAELQTQRQSLSRTQGMLKETESIAVRAQAVLQAMARRTVTNKIVTALVILLLLVIIALISYFKFIRPRLVPL